MIIEKSQYSRDLLLVQPDQLEAWTRENCIEKTEIPSQKWKNSRNPKSILPVTDSKRERLNFPDVFNSEMFWSILCILSCGNVMVSDQVSMSHPIQVIWYPNSSLCQESGMFKYAMQSNSVDVCKGAAIPSPSQK